MKFLKIAGMLGALTVILGAFGAHALKPHLSDYQTDIYEKAVHYQFFHVLALGLTGMLSAQGNNSRWLNYAAWMFIAGIVCFSGSLYLLACRDMLPFSVFWAGPVTPLGGVCFIAGWLMLYRSAAR